MVLLQALLIYVVAGILSYTQSYILAGTVQRSMSKLRSDVEDKLNRLPLAYVDSQPRGDLLSRVTNDIDNVAQSLQQTLSMMLTSTLTIIGVVIMMISISPLLAIITLITVPDLAHGDEADHPALEEEVHRAVALHRHAERAGRGGVHRPRPRQGRSASRTRCSARSTSRTRSSTSRASARSSSPGPSSPR